MIRSAILLALSAVTLIAQTWVAGEDTEAVQGPLRSSYVKSAGRGMIDVRDLDGAFVKSAARQRVDAQHRSLQSGAERRIHDHLH